MLGPSVGVVEEVFVSQEFLRRMDLSDFEPLKAAVKTLLEEVGLATPEIFFVPSAAMPTAARDAAAIHFETDEELLEWPKWTRARPLEFSGGLAVNVDHGLNSQSLRSLLGLAADEPELAALTLVECLLGTPVVDPGLLRAVARVRDRRLEPMEESP